MIPRVVNLLSAAAASPHHPPVETVHPLVETSSVRIEHLVSRGQASSEGFWYDQPGDEWVMLVRGTATLEFAAPDAVESLDLHAGDGLTIPARLKHRVAEVSSDAVWVAVHFGNED